MGSHVNVLPGSIPNDSVEFPSGQIPVGQPGSNLLAFLISANATFGFNETPHRLDMDFVPVGSGFFHGASGQLPDIGRILSLNIGSFYFKGEVIHSDYKSSTAGTLVKVILEDTRKVLDNLKIHTEDIGDPPSGIASPAQSYRVNTGFVNIDNEISDPLVFEYKKINEQGATYSQILQSITDAYNSNKSYVHISQLPPVETIEANIGDDINALRFKFDMTPFSRAMTRILQDTGFDWYWNMSTNQVQVVNKKIEFLLNESQILDLVSEFGSASGLNETTSTSFGKDVVQDPTRIRLLGGHQQGFINSPLLSPIDGLETEGLSGVVFTPIWDQIALGFFDNDGFYRTYIPKDIELKMALAGIEQWSYFKKYQTTSTVADPAGFGLGGDAGSTAAQHTTFQSRLDPVMPLSEIADEGGSGSLRIISNRRDQTHNWVQDFYNRVHSHAERHYGRSYVASGILVNGASGLFSLVDAAWCNLENQAEGGTVGPSGSTDIIFTSDYEINRRFGPISPFVTDDLRVGAHVVLPANTVYGPQGDSAPAGFTNWTEDSPPFNPDGDGSHYIPITLTEVGGRVVNPRSDDLYNFEHFPEGTLWCQLPTLVGTNLTQNSTLANLATLIELSERVNNSGLFDIYDPTRLVEPYLELSGVAIPIEAPIRYGQEYPTSFVLGESHYRRGETVIVDDAYVPWNFFPVGSGTSLTVMQDRAIAKIRGELSPDNESTYADFMQIGLPLITFDSFAEQNINSDGLYGERTHGVTDLNISFSLDGFQTRYKIASNFSQFGREAPLGERTRAFINGIIKPIDFTALNLLNAIPEASQAPPLPGDTQPSIPIFTQRSSSVQVTIFDIFNVFSPDDCADPDNGPVEETYTGFTDSNGRFGRRPAQNGASAPCIDGFLNIGDTAIYVNDDFQLPDGRVVNRYFVGGRQFGNGQVVQVLQNNVADPSVYDVKILDPKAEEQNIVRAICGVPVLGEGGLVAGQRVTLAAQGDASVKPGNSASGIYLNNATGGSNVQACEIVGLDNQGLSTAFAYARPLNLNGSIDPTGTLVSGVPIPFPAFAQVSDRGIYIAASSTSGIIHISRQSFIKYTNS